ncbi:MAG: site-specific integrase [Bacteroidales bacterium]|nr:site-specific integrase [Bacteroidales bacterium]
MRQKFIVLAKASKKNPGENKPIYLRVSDGVAHDWKERTPFVVDPAVWNADRQEATIKPIMSSTDRETWGELNMKLAQLRNFINQKFTKDKIANSVGSNWLEEALAEFFAKPQEISIHEITSKFLTDPNHNIADSRKKQFAVLFRSLERYQLYVRLTRPHMKKYCLDIREIDSERLNDLWNYMRDEATILDKYPEIEAEIPRRKKTDVRSTNTLAGIFKRFRAFLNWCIGNNYLESNPFDHYHIESELYGTPVYLTTEEVKKIYATDMSSDPELEMQRDIFVFHCNIGCRVGDLMDFKKTDVVKGFISYIPDKTINENPRTVSVPLNDTAKAIVKKYKNTPGDKLLPFIRSQDYNDSIKKILRSAKITRQVVILDPVTRTEQKVSIASIASSHMARRTFVGNIYKQVKDPNLVGALTGHVEGSRAFSRYRAIDDDMKKELVNIIG